MFTPRGIRRAPPRPAGTYSDHADTLRRDPAFRAATEWNGLDKATGVTHMMEALLSRCSEQTPESGQKEGVP
ncbi:hypothetical protein HOK021_12940 [Streptomyces hygroscopicus]|nr:hypothetical protein HOK021_12940 [Streptomyces hygroscopicus]